MAGYAARQNAPADYALHLFEPGGALARTNAPYIGNSDVRLRAITRAQNNGFYAVGDATPDTDPHVFLVGVDQFGGVNPTNDTELDKASGAGIVMLVFLTPFVLIGLGAVGAIALSLFGSLRVFVEPSEVRVSVGVGPVRRTRRFDPARAVGIGEGESDVEVDNRARTDIVVDLVGDGGGNGESGSEFRFGASLRGPRRVWVRQALRGELVLEEKG